MRQFKKTTTSSSRGNSTSWCSQQWASITSYNIFTFSSNTNKTWRKKGITSTFNLLFFDTPRAVPTIKVKCTTEWTKHFTYSTCWWSNLYRILMVVCNTRLLHSQSYYTIPINISCWVLHIWTSSCFDSNYSKFRFGT